MAFDRTVLFAMENSSVALKQAQNSQISAATAQGTVAVPAFLIAPKPTLKQNYWMENHSETLTHTDR